MEKGLLHIKFARKGKGEVFHEIFFISSGEAFVLSVYFAGKDIPEGVFHGITEPIIHYLRLISCKAQLYQLADFIGGLTIFQQADYYNHSYGNPRIFFVYWGSNQFCLNIVVYHAFGQRKAVMVT